MDVCRAFTVGEDGDGAFTRSTFVGSCLGDGVHEVACHRVVRCCRRRRHEEDIGRNVELVHMDVCDHRCHRELLHEVRDGVLPWLRCVPDLHHGVAVLREAEPCVAGHQPVVCVT